MSAPEMAAPEMAPPEMAAPEMPGPLLRLDRVAAAYRTGPVFRDLSLDIPAGAFIGIVGPTGAGKTTLLKILLGTLPPRAGRVLLKGETLGPGNRARIGYVPQRGAVDGWFPATVEQVVLMGLRGRRLPPWPTRAERGRVREIAERLGIAAVLRHHIRDVSGGQQQRAFLARALVSGPDLLVLDEPTSGVDMRTQHEILGLLRELNRGGITIVMTTHDLNAVAVHLPTVLCFNRGSVAFGNPGAVFTDAVLARTFGEALVVIRHQGGLAIAHALASPIP
jgi:zinc/manganese transport system ATP-binding protein